MVNQYESDDLRTKDEMLNPYSDLNKSTHALDEKLASWAEGMRTKFSNADDVDKYLCKKYFGQERIGYTMKDHEPEKYAMYKNDLNMVLYGTVRAYQFDLKDPRINNPQYTSINRQNKLKMSDNEIESFYFCESLSRKNFKTNCQTVQIKQINCSILPDN